VLGTALFGIFFFHRMHVSNYSTRTITLLVGNCAVAALRGFATALIAVSLCLTARIRAWP
jgi:hypothetical protein